MGTFFNLLENRKKVMSQLKDDISFVQFNVDIINTAIDPEDFFSSFGIIASYISKFEIAEKRGYFKKPYPSEQFRKIMINYEDIIHDLINRIAKQEPNTAIMYYGKLLSYDLPQICKEHIDEELGYIDEAFYKAGNRLSIGPHYINEVSNENFYFEYQAAKHNSNDLMISGNSGSCCSKCAKFRRRIYSISGNDKRFPKLPTYECTCNGVPFFVYQDGMMTHFPSDDIVAYSNRPFIDDRTDEEKRGYQYVLDSRFYEKCIENDRKLYGQLMQQIPDTMPKSFTAFRRMKNSNSKSFRILSAKAAALGVDIDMTDEERNIIERYQTYKKEHNC